MDLANTKSCPPNSFAQIGQDEEAIEPLLFAAVLAAVSVPQETTAGPRRTAEDGCKHDDGWTYDGSIIAAIRYFAWQHSKKRLYPRNGWIFQSCKLFEDSKVQTQYVDRLTLGVEGLKPSSHERLAKWEHKAQFKIRQDSSTSEFAGFAAETNQRKSCTLEQNGLKSISTQLTCLLLYNS